MMKTFSTFIILFLFACKSPNRPIDFDKIEKEYSIKSNDSLWQQALHYLKREVQGQTSDMPIFKDANTGRISTITLNSFSSFENLWTLTKMLNIEPGSLTKPDVNIINAEFIKNEITASVSLWNKYPWNRDIPKEIFFDYLLPYKIHHEYPDNWRYQLKLKTDSLINLRENKFNKSPNDPFLSSSKELYYDLIVNTASHWFKYGQDKIRITEDPSYKELTLLKEGGCKKGSFYNAYVLRSAGIPATVDIIPHWGSKNGTHAGDVYWNNEEKKMTPGPGRRFERPAKVFRLTFRNHNSWTVHIKPYILYSDFLLDFLKNDHWLDVTNEHTITSDIKLPVIAKKGYSVPAIAYVCVFDYGNWVPLFWGTVNNNLVVFKNMGRNIVYRIATFENEFQFNGKVFLLDSVGKIKYFFPDQNNKQRMNLQKINSGSESWVAKNTSYSLYLLERDSEWRKVAENICKKDSAIEFLNIPSGTLYRLVKSNGTQQLERIFAYEKKQQVWY